MKTYTHFLLLFILSIASCKTPMEATSSSATLYKIDEARSNTGSEIENLLKPYRDSLNLIMNEVIAHADGDFIKEKPGGSLGFLVVDAMYEKAKSINSHTMNAVCNYGGIRLPEIRKGPVTTSKIFELLPFDNELVLLEIKGEILQKWVSFMDSAGGWPIRKPVTLTGTAGQEMYISDGTFSNEADYKAEKHYLHKDSIYIVATNDYLADGGDNCSFLKQCKRQNTGVLIRDLMIEYVKMNKTIYPVKYYQFKN